MMRRIIEASEASSEKLFPRLNELDSTVDPGAYVIRAAVRATGTFPVKAVICNTASGASARRGAVYRPRIPVFAFSHHAHVVRQLSLVYGVTAEHIECIEDPMELSRISAQHLLDNGLLQPDDLVVLLSKNKPSITRNNLCCIATIRELLN